MWRPFDLYVPVDDVMGYVEVPIKVGELMNFTVSNENDGVGDRALTNFKLQLKDHPDEDWYDYIADAGFDPGNVATNPNLRFASVSPQTLAVGSKARVHVRINAAIAVRFGVQAAVGGNGAHVRIRGNVQR